LSAALSIPLAAQSTPTPPASAPAPEEEDEEVVLLSPFEVTTEDNEGYSAATTLAGNRLNTELRDVGNAVSVITPQFLRDIGATSNESLLQYTTGTEVGSIQGNFAGLGDGAQLNETDQFKNPNQNTRVRGLAAADNARDYFLTDIPWDGYNVDRVDLQRGPNSIMFGQGSPAGLINTSTQSAAFRNSGDIDVRFGSFGSNRASLNLNRELIDDELAVRIAILHDHEKFKQKPAFDKDRRVYGAIRWEPAFLKRGNARTVLKANYENGQIDSNRPRTLPPYDHITPWFLTGTYEGRRPGDGDGDGQARPGELAPYTFQRLNKLTVNAYQAQQDNLYRPGHGVNRPGINGGPYTGALNPSYRPELGAMAQSLGGAPWAYYAGNGAPEWWNEEPREFYGIGTDGSIIGGVGFNFHRPVTIGTPSQWAKAAGVEFSEIYKNASITDPTIFNFYNNLIDGNNKKEWSDWDSYSIDLSQTFMDDKFGIQLIYNTETYRNGQLSFLTDTRQSIRIDMMNVHADGTQAGTGTWPDNLPFGDGTPNANVGRPYITDNGQFGNNRLLSERTGKRATAFFRHDFEREGNSSTLTRILGSHTFTGLLSEDERETDNRSWQRYAILDGAWRSFQGYNDSSTRWDNGDFTPSAIIYLGPSLMNASSASGANLSRVTEMIDMGGTFTVNAFNSIWNSPNVNPADPWVNPVFLPPEVEYNLAPPGSTAPGYDPEDPDAPADRSLTTQNRNPLNYTGWQQVPLTITDSEDGNRDLLTTNAQLERNLTKSKALVWQGKLLDNSIVGTYGWREDESERWQYQQGVGGRNAPGFLDLSPEMYHLPEVVDGEIVDQRSGHDGNDGYGSVPSVTSRAYSVVAHLNDLPGFSSFLERSPLNVSLLYAHSTNFQPLANRVNLYGEQIAPPEGKTRERGILFETKDGKYSFKVNEYRTAVSNANSSGLSNQWFISASQQWAGNWVNRFEHNWRGDNIDSLAPEPTPGTEDWDLWNTNTLFNYGTAAGETQEQARARENAAIAAWRAWQANPIAQRMYEAFQIDLNRPFIAGTGGLPASTPPGFTLTEDAVSSGYEFEFSALPARNWRVTFNASKSKATRRNVGGESLAEFVAAYETALKTTPAGDVRIWWGGAGNETTLFQWNQNVGFEWTSRKLQEGTQAPEIREWRFNAITNYDFTEGRLKGFNVGGGVRYQDSVIIGYHPIQVDPQTISIDLNDPYTAPSETNFDFWVGYSRRIRENIDWRIQLNVRNAFDGNDLIPITVQPDGTPAAYRIAPSRVLTLSNTFSF
jgi:outer membrane receptor protein involved in Fe transport